MVWILLVATCALLCSNLGLGERRTCYTCLMNYPGVGCIPGADTCGATSKRGQSCVTVRYFYQEEELYRVHSCTRPGVHNCGTRRDIEGFTIQFDCCTESDMCNKVLFTEEDDDGLDW